MKIQQLKHGNHLMWDFGTDRFPNLVRLLLLFPLSASLSCAPTVRGQIPPFAGEPRSPAAQGKETAVLEGLRPWQPATHHDCHRG